MPVMTQADITRRERLDRLPGAVTQAARDMDRGVARRAVAVATRAAADAKEPEFVQPTALQRLGYYIRCAIYPANFAAEWLALMATAAYIVKAVGNVPATMIWIAPPAMATVFLLLEIFVAHAREASRNDLGRPAAGWTLAAVLVLMMPVGLLAAAQVADARAAVPPGAPLLSLSQLDPIDWTRIVCFGALLAALHAAVLFGGPAQEKALAYGLFRANRRLTGARIWWHGHAERRHAADFAALVSTYHTLRRTHEARGHDPGPMPAFDPTTLAMLRHLERRTATPTDETAAAEATSSNAAGTPATSDPAPAPSRDAAAVETPPATTAAAGPAAAQHEAAASDVAGLEHENAHLRAVLDARVRNDDGEVRPPTAA